MQFTGAKIWLIVTIALMKLLIILPRILICFNCPHHALTCRGEDSHHQAEPSVAQQSDLRLVCLAAFLHLLGLHGGPDAGAQHHQVEEHHHHQSWDIQAHRALTELPQRIDHMLKKAERISF